MAFLKGNMHDFSIGRVVVPHFPDVLENIVVDVFSVDASAEDGKGPSEVAEGPVEWVEVEVAPRVEEGVVHTFELGFHED